MDLDLEGVHGDRKGKKPLTRHSRSHDNIKTYLKVIGHKYVGWIDEYRIRNSGGM